MDRHQLREKISGQLSAGALASTEQHLQSLYPAEIADLLESLPIPQRHLVWGLLAPEVEGEVLLEVNEGVRENLIKITDPEELISALEELDVDQLAQLFIGLPTTVSNRVLASMEEQDRRRLERVLSYDKDSAGGLMDLNTVTIRKDLTLDTVLRYLQMRGELPSHTNKLMVIDRTNHYIGSVQLSQLLIHTPETRISKIMNTNDIVVDANTPADEVARLFEDRQLVSAPVVDSNNQLLGRITVDDVLDIIHQKAQQTEFTAAGLRPDEDLFTPVGASSKQRALWLGINLATAFLAAWVISLFQGTLEKIILLAVLMPVVSSMAGIAGGQTLTLIIRGVATGQIGPSNWRALLLKELAVGLLNGCVWAVVIMLAVILWFGNVAIGIIIGVSTILSLFFSALSGAMIPAALKKLNVDPAIAGGVILTTFTDIIGIFSFLGLATLFLL